MRKLAGFVGVLVMVAVLAGCTSRLNKDDGQAKQDAPSVQLRAWSQLHSEPYGIPVRVLQAYAYAAAAMDKAVPGCGIGWSTLAAIGEVSSDHGSASGASVDANGNVSPKLRGLSQANPAHATPVADTDAGRYDGNSLIDVTMGPMQMMPSKWEQFATDANNDGVADPDNFDDAALTVARFLCAAGGDLRKSDGWAAAVAQYNSTPGLVEKVHAYAGRYGR
ncbi:lytic transglycosylase domain-containing protein [Gordonia sp. TBRC 11910]|uniref:Lytic transglycosylase domain-containing protein n=1 Tax=Gordonia asplenii TaxID=2725283 RepID=A0A848KYG1_9ACTN|nr:lytic murein transglycosylase [Gordonia asplenii]NMO00478.1 lytic transglycosylase domain-containing protein [Gordonia asplenii]